MLGDHNLWRKTYAYEGSAHIPMIIRLPKELQDKKVSHVDEVVTLYDIMPTILDIVGADIPETVDGKSMYSLIKGEEDDWREYFHGEHCECYSYEQDMHYLTDGHYKYVWLSQLGTEQLFDLDNDREEMYDLSRSDEYKVTLKKWRERLIKELEPRDAGLVLDGKLVCQKGKPPVISPKYEERVNRVKI
jgi:arylsulfatase A-like enzyme